jgi:hypothetical protein
MKRIVILATLVLAYASFASDLWVGRLWGPAGTSVNNTNTQDDAGTFLLSNNSNVPGNYMVQCLTDSCVATSRDAGLSVACANTGVNPAVATPAEAVSAGLMFDISLTPSHFVMAAKASDGGIVSCDVYRRADPQ